MYLSEPFPELPHRNQKSPISPPMNHSILRFFSAPWAKTIGKVVAAAWLTDADILTCSRRRSIGCGRYVMQNYRYLRYPPPPHHHHDHHHRHRENMGKCEPAKSQVMSQSPNMLLLYWCAKRMRGGDADDGGSLLMRFGARVAPPAL